MTLDEIIDLVDDELLDREAAIKLLLGHPEADESLTADAIGGAVDRLLEEKRSDQLRIRRRFRGVGRKTSARVGEVHQVPL
jgi:hypothetical protein